MTKEFLASLDPPFTRSLPPGIQQELADDFGLHYQVIGRILKGSNEASDETTRKVYLAAKAKLNERVDRIGEAEAAFLGNP